MKIFVLIFWIVIFGTPCVTTSDESGEQDSTSDIVTSEAKAPEPIKILCKNRKDRKLIRVTSDEDHIVDIDVINPQQPTVFIIHGWLINLNTAWTENLADVFLTHTTWNACIVDWITLTHTHTDVLSAVHKSQYVGNFLAEFLTCFSKKNNIRHDHIILIGHSMGARVAAYCSKQMKGNIGAIYALDPIAPELAPASAFYTQCIFTGVGHLKPSVGNCQTNFYVNGGQQQPMCHNVKDAFCSHLVSILYFGFSLDQNNKFSCRFCRVNIFDVFCLFNEWDGLGIYSKRKLGTFECKTKNEPPYAMDDNDEHLLPKTFKVDLQEEGEEGNLVK